MVPDSKRENGQYFTRGNCFALSSFREWFESIPNYNKITLIEPFAGCGNIPKLMKEAGYTNKWAMFDLYPQQPHILTRDSIRGCPSGDCIITNPPYLARNSAKRRGLKFPDTKYDDLYKLALERMLDSALYVAAIIPESFITSGLFLNRVSRIISLKIKMFDDTDCPVCLALFSPADEPVVYSDDAIVGSIAELRRHLPASQATMGLWSFNDSAGDIGLIAIDDTRTASIRFVRGDSIPSNIVKSSSRSITRVSGDGTYSIDGIIASANDILGKLRKDTQDVFLTAFKGIRRDGMYRRRLDFGLARRILDVAKNINTNAGVS